MKNIDNLINKSANIANIQKVFDEVRFAHEHGEHPGYSTGWSKFDNFFKFPPFGQLNVVSGSPGSGKSEWVDSLALQMATQEGWKVFVYSPENNPLSYHLKKMVQKMSGKPFIKHPDFGRVSKEDIDKAEKFMENHFTFINCQLKGSTVEEIVNSIILQATISKVNMVIIDPWNKIENSTTSKEKETEYIGRVLTKFQMLAREYNIHIFIVAHPTKPMKNKDGSYASVTLYDISGSAHWYNMTDNGFILTRTWRQKITLNEFYSNIKICKIKDSRYGRCGEHDFEFQPHCGRYIDAIKPSGDDRGPSNW